MNSALLILGIVQTANLLVYRWVNKVFMSQPIINHPAIFYNSLARVILCYGPYIIGLLLIILAFFLTDSPWLFLGLTVAGFVACSERPHSDLS